MPVLEADGIRKKYKKNEVLKGASFNVDAGEIVGIVGENGSGKSTLMRIVAGLQRSDAGTVFVRGEYGYCPQEPLVFDGLTMEENIAYFGSAFGLAPDEASDRGTRLMDRLRCDDHRRTQGAQLSGGTKQKLNLILSLLHDPELLILDEPYQGFDYDSYLAFWDLAGDMARDGRSVVVVSHLMHDMSHLTRLYKLENGRAIDG